MKSIASALVLFVSCVCFAQKASLYAVTAEAPNSTNVEVIVRWQISSGWIPAGGLKLYRIVGAQKTLVAALPAPTDDAVDTLLPMPLRGQHLIQKASGLSTSIIDFNVVRPPVSSQNIFVSRQSLLNQIQVLQGPIPAPQRTQLEDQLNALKPVTPQTNPQTSTQSTPTFSTLSRTALVSPIDPVALVRKELHVAAFTAETPCKVLSLGATDAQPGALGATVSYQLAAVNPTGEVIVGALNNFQITAPQNPPPPTGLQYLQDDDKIQLRWDRLPATSEQALLQANYIVRKSVAGNSFINLTGHPLLISTLNGNVEPDAFFTDDLQTPDRVTYEVLLRDGFGRQSDPAIINISPRDWRLPPAPRVVGASPGLQFKQSIAHVLNPLVGSTATVPVLTPQGLIGWMPVRSPDNLIISYNVYRYDLDNLDQPPAKLTPQPIRGTPMSVSTDADLNSAIDIVYGGRIAAFNTEIAELQTKEQQMQSGNQDITAIAKAIALDQAKENSLLATLRANLPTNPPFGFNDVTAGRDHKYEYSISCVYPNGNESIDVHTAEIDFPDPASPGGAGTITSNITPNPAPPITYSLPTATTSGPLPNPILFAKMNAAQQALAKFKTTAKDFGASISLDWPSSPKIGVKYQIRRAVIDPKTQQADPKTFTSIGVTAPGVSTFADNVPRTGVRSYVYEITPISRWNVKGFPTTTIVAVPATIAPDAPSILSVSALDPSANQLVEGKLFVTFSTVTDQGVTSYAVFRDGTQIATIPMPTTTPPPSSLFVTDTPGDIGQNHSYTVVATTVAPISSQPSQAFSAAALKLTEAAPSNVKGSPSAKGVMVTWNAVSDAANYIVRRRTAGGAAVVISANTTGTSFLDVFATTGVSYTYEVLAVDQFGNVSDPAISDPVTGA